MDELDREELRAHTRQLQEDSKLCERWDAPGQWTRGWLLPVENVEDGRTGGYIITLHYAKIKRKEFITVSVRRSVW
jgi:hypothetical protein